MTFTARLLCGIASTTLMMAAALAGEGQVVSSINTAGYTYVEVIQDGKTMWLAAEVIDLKPGNRIHFDDGALMTNFHSSSLERDFPAVLFVDQVKVIPEK